MMATDGIACCGEVIESCDEDEPIWKDLKSEPYKQALGETFDTYREDRYKHLSDKRFPKLNKLVTTNSDCLVIEGVEPSTIEGYEFDLELQPGAQPV